MLGTFWSCESFYPPFFWQNERSCTLCIDNSANLKCNRKYNFAKRFIMAQNKDHILWRIANPELHQLLINKQEQIAYFMYGQKSELYALKAWFYTFLAAALVAMEPKFWHKHTYSLWVHETTKIFRKYFFQEGMSIMLEAVTLRLVKMKANFRQSFDIKRNYYHLEMTYWHFRLITYNYSSSTFLSGT